MTGTDVQSPATELAAARGGAVLRTAYWIVFGLLGAFGIYTVLITGPGARASADQNLQRTIAEENRTFCEKFGMRIGTDEFAACGMELMIIRQNQQKRSDGNAQGLI
jgi:hypothetical protein